MLAAAFLRHIEKDSPAPVYLFKGDAELLMEEAWRGLLEKLVPPGARRFNGERLSAREWSAEQVVARLRTVPMFGKRNLLMVQHIEAWPKDQWKVMHAYVANPSPTACLVLALGPQKGGADKFEKAVVASSGTVVEFRVPQEREIPGWIQERAKHHRKRIRPQAASFLAAQVGADLHRLERELEKLVIFAGNREVIELEDVKEIVSLQRSFSVFEMLRYIGKRQSIQAVGSLRNLILAGESPLGILALLARQIRHLWQIKEAAERGLSLPQMAQQLKLPPFAVKDYLQQTSSFSEGQLYQIHKRLRETDLSLKRTGIPPETVLEQLILDLCRS